MPIDTASTVTTRGALFIALCAMLLLAAPARGQDGSPQPDGDSGVVVAQARRTGIEEIVVTAQKRSEDLQEVPISITALTSEFVEASGITNFDALQQYVPNFSVNQVTDSRSSAVRIRGIGSDGNNAGIDPSVGVFVDGVYQGRTGLVAVADLSDIERIEVLRGPQGTLYGKNTAAGAMNVVTRKPNLEKIEGQFSGLLANFANKEVRGSINIPLTDKIATRFSGYWVKRDGFDINTFDGSERNNADRNGFRLKTLFDVDEDLEVMMWVEYANQADRCCAPDVIDATGAPSLDVTYQQLADLVGRGLPNTDPFDGVLAADEPTTNDTTVVGVATEVNWDVGDFLVTSLTAYRRFKTDTVLDGDFSDYRVTFNTVAETFEQVSTELRLTSPQDETLEYVAGFYFYYSRDDTVGRTGIGPDWLDVSATGAGIRTGADERGLVFNTDTNIHETWSYALFGQGTYRFNEQWSLTAGIRGTYERKRRAGSQISGFKADAGPFGPDTFFGLECIVDPNALVEPFCKDAENLRVFNVSPMASLQFYPTEDSMAFLRFARGFKSGGFNQLRTIGARNTQFDDEKALDLEAGIRTTWFDRMLTLNATFFYTWYDDFQSQVFNGSSFIVTNAGSLTSYGIEADAVFVPHPALVIGTSVGWNVAEYETFKDAPCTVQQQFDQNPDVLAERIVGCGQDLSGEKLDNAPEWTVSVFSQLTLPVGRVPGTEDMLQTFLRAEYAHRSSIALAQDLDPGLFQRGTHIVNLRGGLQTEDGRWELTGWVRNLTQEEFIVVGFDVPILNGFAGVHSPPRQYGATLRYRF